MIRHTRMKKFLANGRSDFLAGLAVVLPVAVSIAVVIWLFGIVSHFTDALLLLVPEVWIRNGDEPLHLYSRVFALLVAMLLIVLVGRLGRFSFGKKLIQGVDGLLMRVPLLNRMYTALKQIHEAFTSSKAASFKQVVLVEFPRPGLYSIGFITGAENVEVQSKTQKRLLGVFVPTPPLTSGSIVLVPEGDVVKLEMSVADGIKFIMSLGSVSPAYLSREGVYTGEAVGHSKGSGLRSNGEPGWSFGSPAPSPRLFLYPELSDDLYEFIKADRATNPKAIS
jgi:uncharacterized membrane protein